MDVSSAENPFHVTVGISIHMEPSDLARRNPSHMPLAGVVVLCDRQQIIGVPYLFGDLTVELAALNDVSGHELLIRFERQPAAFDEPDKARVLLVAHRMQTRGQDVLLEVVRSFLWYWSSL